MLGVVSQQRCVRLDGGLKASYVRTVQDSFCASLSNSDPPSPSEVGSVHRLLSCRHENHTA